MRKWLLCFCGLSLLGGGVYIIKSSQPVEGGYRYPRQAREEARQFARSIKDKKERSRFLADTTGRVKVEHPKMIFLGGIMCTLGFGLSLGSLHSLRTDHIANRKGRDSIKPAA